MTALILQATPFVEMVAPKLQAVYKRVLQALDAFAESRYATPCRPGSCVEHSASSIALGG